MPLGAPGCTWMKPRTISPRDERVEKALRVVAPTLRLTQADQEQLLPHVRITRYGADEALQFAGQVPKRMTFIVNGQVRLIATATTVR